MAIANSKMNALKCNICLDVVAYLSSDRLYVMMANKLPFSVFVVQENIDAYIQDHCTFQEDENGGKYWSCGICHKYLNRKMDVVRHIESFHVETTPYYCTYCDSQFKTRRAVQRHILSIHKS